jgi:hypothetical protein
LGSRKAAFFGTWILFKCSFYEQPQVGSFLLLLNMVLFLLCLQEFLYL